MKPRNAVVSSAISRYIRNFLRQPRIDNEIIKVHTTSSASTSKDGLRGLSVTDILEIGFWSNASNWQRFYHRQNESSAEK